MGMTESLIINPKRSKLLCQKERGGNVKSRNMRNWRMRIKKKRKIRILHQRCFLMRRQQKRREKRMQRRQKQQQKRINRVQNINLLMVMLVETMVMKQQRNKVVEVVVLSCDLFLSICEFI